MKNETKNNKMLHVQAMRSAPIPAARQEPQNDKMSPRKKCTTHCDAQCDATPGIGEEYKTTKQDQAQ